MMVRVAVVLVKLVTVREGGEGCAVCVEVKNMCIACIIDNVVHNIYALPLM